MSECDTYCETIIFCRLSTLFYRRDSLANQQPNRRESLAKLRRQSLAQIERQSSSFQQQRSANEYNVRGIAINPQSRGYNYDRRRSSVLGQCLTKLTRIEQSHVWTDMRWPYWKKPPQVMIIIKSFHYIWYFWHIKVVVETLFWLAYLYWVYPGWYHNFTPAITSNRT